MFTSASLVKDAIFRRPEGNLIIGDPDAGGAAKTKQSNVKALRPDNTPLPPLSEGALDPGLIAPQLPFHPLIPYILFVLMSHFITFSLCNLGLFHYCVVSQHVRTGLPFEYNDKIIKVKSAFSSPYSALLTSIMVLFSCIIINFDFMLSVIVHDTV